MRSVFHRGTPENPGLVLALRREAAAVSIGYVLRPALKESAGVLDSLRRRELVTDAYREETVRLETASGDEVLALAYVVDTGHAQYCGRMALAEQARIIACAHGRQGSNAEYLFRTAACLRQNGIEDPEITELARLVSEMLNSRTPRKSAQHPLHQ